ncbi:uncharacterized protein V6R79_014019 [Siganus canaliculatus]
MAARLRKTGPRSLHMIQDTEQDLRLLQLDAEVGHKVPAQLSQEVRPRQEAERSRVREVQEKVSDSEGLSQFLLDHRASGLYAGPRRWFEEVAAAVTELSDKLDLQPEPEPEPDPGTRDEFWAYSGELTLDPNTASRWLKLSHGNRRATRSRRQAYPAHPARFRGWRQVLSGQGLTGRCYWEVEWSGNAVGVAVAYGSIGRAPRSDQSAFGRNHESWMLKCSGDGFRFRHDNVTIPVSGRPSSRVGVYLDHAAGVLDFYSVSETRTLLHRVQTTFRQPLHAGLRLYPLDLLPSTTTAAELRPRAPPRSGLMGGARLTCSHLS